MRAHVVLVLALGACDPQADGGYPGEAIAVLPGSVASPGGVVVDGMEIYWQDVDPRGPGALQSPLPVRTRFPGGFEASLIAPPPPGALMQFDGEARFAEGYLFALQWKRGALVPAGTDYRHALVWAESDVLAGTTTAEYLGGPTGRGFHVMRWTATPTPSRAQQILVARCVAAARAAGWEEAAATLACRSTRSYQLGEEPEGMATVWMMYVLQDNP
jgi:hypothetical protein